MRVSPTPHPPSIAVLQATLETLLFYGGFFSTMWTAGLGVDCHERGEITETENQPVAQAYFWMPSCTCFLWVFLIEWGYISCLQQTCEQPGVRICETL